MKQIKIVMILINFCLLITYTPMLAQLGGTGLGTLKPHPSAVLDVVNTKAGILIPRMNVDKKNEIKAPATGLLVYDTTNKSISQNSGTPEAPTWVSLAQKKFQNSFFYMPSIAIDASKISSGTEMDLYEEYKKQFSKPAAKSENAPDVIPYFPKATDLYYYILGADSSIINLVWISSIGTINYKIIKESEYSTFINVVFVLKEQ